MKEFRVLDPACGSGNFLFLGLKTLKDIEHKSHLEAAAMGLDREANLVTGPHNMLGIELNEYAAELARVAVWIGELQWRLTHGYEFKKNPVLEPLDNIECRDALLTFVPDVAGVGDGESAGRAARQRPAAHTLRFLKSPPTSAPLPDQLGSSSSNLGSDPSTQGAGSDPNLRVQKQVAVEADWPKASVVIGNPPFLGDRKMIRELGEDYAFALRRVYEGRVPGGADLVCYWFEKARTALEKHGLEAAGLVATNSIRGGANRKVLDLISQSSRIYEAWSDEAWVNEGAGVRVSLVAFGQAIQDSRLDGARVQLISSDLQSTRGASDVQKLAANAKASYIGTQKNGPFDIPREQAMQWLALPYPHGKSNSRVLRPWANGLDVTRRPKNRWVVDFGCDMSLADAALFEAPYAYVEQAVKPTRADVRREWHRTHWWLYDDARPGLRDQLALVQRFMVTPMVAKHRVFAWMPSVQIPENLCVAITRADDAALGILHSRFHELWSLRMGTSLEARPRYTPTTCFETFPFPAGLTPQDTANQQTETLPDGSVIPASLAPGLRTSAEAIAKAAKHLNNLRENWLNPPEWTNRIPEVTPLGMATSPYPDRIIAKPGYEKELLDRTLTKLYNQRAAWLDAAHKQLDAVVAAAYNWADYTAEMPDEEILKRLLALNLERAA